MERQLIALCIVLGLSLAAGADAVAASQPAQRADTDALASVGLVARGAGYGSSGGSDVVRHVQRRLRELGFRPGPVDGLFGPRTERAVRSFQRSHGLIVDGIVGPQTRTHMRYHVDPTKPFAGLGSGYSRPGGSDLVREIQRRLRALGFRPGPVDGLFGPRTERAVRSFQESGGGGVDGVVLPPTLSELSVEVARRNSPDDSVRAGQDTSGGQRMPKPTRVVEGTPDGSTGASGFPTVLVAVLAGLAGVLALLLLGRTVIASLFESLFATFVSLASRLRSKGLTSGRFPSAGQGTAGRGGTQVREGPNPAGRATAHNGPAGARFVAAPPGRRSEREADQAPTKRIPLAAPKLTDRELAALRLAAEGFTNAQIGARLFLSQHTVKEHLSHAMRKLGVTNRLKAVRQAVSLGLLDETGTGAEPGGDPESRLADKGRAEANRASELRIPPVKEQG
jgi:peptidoglycan hydrolase-like protein with peptidoglycan-binding domain/DNA-binding CsgD family transcriptional regulator